MIEVTMLIRSGLPNPKWGLGRNDSREFMDRILGGGATVLAVGEGDSTLGYDGFLVETSGWHAAQLRNDGKPTSFRIAAEQSRPSPADGVTAEQWLVDGNRTLDDGLLAEVSADLDRISKGISRSSADVLAASAGDADEPSGGPGSDDEPDSDDGEEVAIAGRCLVRGRNNSNFDFWNAEDRHLFNNNCYNFSSAWRTNTFAQPGRGGTGRAYWEDDDVDDMNALIGGCFDDGFFQGNPCDDVAHLKLAAVIRPREHRFGWDYHFYRRVSNDNIGQRWAHKPGGTPAKNTDDSGRWIRNPETADRGGYTDWGGYVYHRGDRSRIIR